MGKIDARSILFPAGQVVLPVPRLRQEGQVKGMSEREAERLRKRLRAVRARLGWTVETMSLVTGYSWYTITEWLRYNAPHLGAIAALELIAKNFALKREIEGVLIEADAAAGISRLGNGKRAGQWRQRKVKRRLVPGKEKPPSKGAGEVADPDNGLG